MNLLNAVAFPRDHRAAKWIVRTVGTVNQNMRGIATDGTSWLTSATYTSGNRTLKYTTDPESGSWSNKSNGDVSTLYTAYGNGYWFFGGTSADPAYATTVNGTYTTITSDLNQATDTQFGGTYYVGVGGDSTINTTPVCITATDPTGTWTTNSSGIIANNGYFAAVWYDGTYWVRVGDNGMLYTATDPSGTWTARTSSFSTTDINTVHYGNSVWVAAGDSGKLATATDPTGTWTQRTSGFGTDSIFDVAYGGGTWIAVGDNGKMYSASDPTGTWTAMVSGFDNLRAINDIAYSGGLWVAVGELGQIGTYRP